MFQMNSLIIFTSVSAPDDPDLSGQKVWNTTFNFGRLIVSVSWSTVKTDKSRSSSSEKAAVTTNDPAQDFCQRQYKFTEPGGFNV